MHKKIEIFLMVVLVIWFVLLVDATKNRRPPEPTAQLQSSTAETVESDVPAMELPESTASAEGSDLSRVERVLSQHNLTGTAVTHLVQAGDPGAEQAAALAELVTRKDMNPIAAFWVLVSEGLYERGDDRDGLPLYSLPESPEHTVKQYAYTDAGAAELLTELLTLAGGMESEMAKPILGTDGAIEKGQVHLSEKDGCRYAYFAYTTDQSVQILCVYLRSDAAGAQIDDVEFQLLYMNGADEAGDGQAVALAAAAELLMTGTVRAGEETPAKYTVGDCQAEVERFFFAAQKEQGSLTNYRIRK